MSTDPEIPWDWLAMCRDNPLLQGSFDQIMTRLALARQAASADADMSAIGPDGKIDKDRLARSCGRCTGPTTWWVCSSYVSAS
jgi:hypothetical protein